MFLTTKGKVTIALIVIAVIVVIGLIIYLANTPALISTGYNVDSINEVVFYNSIDLLSLLL